LCRHCDEVRKSIVRLEKLGIGKNRKPNFILDWELKVARAEKQDCLDWGDILRGILVCVDPLDLEHWFFNWRSG
jgi:hypothetical protein